MLVKAYNTVDEYNFKIFIHDSVASIWLGPEIVTIRPGQGLFKFNAYARFDDDVISELTNINDTFYPLGVGSGGCCTTLS